MSVEQAKKEVVLRGFFVSFQIGISRRLIVMIDESLDISGNSSIQLAEMLSGDVVVVLIEVTVHHTAGKQTQGYLMDSVVSGNNKHQIGNVSL